MDRPGLRRFLVGLAPSVVLMGVASHEVAYNDAPDWQWATALVAILALVLRRRFLLPSSPSPSRLPRGCGLDER
jgi:hypothetical protein